MRAGTDPVDVGRHDDEHLRRFLAARGRGDPHEMRRWWEELAISIYDRMDALIHLAHDGRLDAHEHEAAVAIAMGKVYENLIQTFRGTSMGELINATKKLAEYVCMDVQRKAQSDRRRSGRSLDELRETDDGHAPSAVELHAAKRDYESAQEAFEARDFLAWALPKLNERRRRVVELSFAGLTREEIQRELGVSPDNAYQLLSRGFKDLRALKQEYDA